MSISSHACHRVERWHVVLRELKSTLGVRLLTKAAVDALDRIFWPGFKYSKAEMIPLNRWQPGEYTDDLFKMSQTTEATRVMTVLDWTRSIVRGGAALGQCGARTSLVDASRANESNLYNKARSALVGSL